MGKVTTLLENEILFKELGLTNFNLINDRAMIYGSMGLNTDIKRILEKFGLKESANSDPSDYVVEKAFVGQLQTESTNNLFFNNNQYFYALMDQNLHVTETILCASAINK